MPHPLRRIPPALSILGILLATLLYFHAASLFTAATTLDALHPGYRHLHNYWCDLYPPLTPTGQPNPGRPFALAATLALVASLFFFWLAIPALFPASRRLILLILLTGTPAAVAASLIFTPLHDIVVALAVPLGTTAIVATCIALAKNRQPLLLTLALLAVTTALADYLAWITHTAYAYQPLLQKSAMLLLFLWVLLATVKILRIPSPLPPSRRIWIPRIHIQHHPFRRP